MITSMLADMAARVESTRLVNQRASWEVDQGRRNTYYASVAKLLSGIAANQNSQDALQVGSLRYCRMKVYNVKVCVSM